jgi:anti-anti-sigma factor
MTFQLRTATSPGDIPSVEIRGDVDAANAASLQAALADLPSPELIIDLSGVSYFDSAGFALIDLLLSRARLAVVLSPGSVLRTAAQLMNIPFHDTVDDARAALRAA